MQLIAKLEMRRIIVAILMLGALSACRSFVNRYLVSKKTLEEEGQFVEYCRNQWSYHDLEQREEIELLYFQPQSSYGFASPSFFIGVNSRGDTIGLLDYDFVGGVSIGDRLLFNEGKSRNDTIDGRISIGHYPIFTVSSKRKRNAILCTVKQIYYAELVR